MQRRWAYTFLAASLALAACDSAVTPVAELAAPALALPADGVGVPDAVELSWAPSPGAKSYHVMVTGEEGIVVDERAVFDPRLDVRGLTMGESYEWQVAAVGEAAEEWSEARRFTVDSRAELPGVPRLAAPLNNAVDLPLDTAVSWEPTDGATRYQLQVSLDSRLLILVVDLEGVEETDFAIRGLVRTYPYWWRVRAKNAAGYGPWSPVWTFKVIN